MAKHFYGLLNNYVQIYTSIGIPSFYGTVFTRYLPSNSMVLSSFLFGIYEVFTWYLSCNIMVLSQVFILCGIYEVCTRYLPANIMVLSSLLFGIYTVSTKKYCSNY